MKRDIKIPSIIGVLLLLTSAFGAVYLTSQPTSLTSKASGDCDPDMIQITNQTDQSADLFFLTSTDCQSSVVLGSKNYSNLRAASPAESQTIHYFRLDGLSPSTNYTYSIISGGKKYQLSNFNFQTRSTTNNNLPDSSLAWGKILTPDRIPAFGAVIFINIPGAAPISAMSNSEGLWNIPLSSTYDANGTSWFQPPPNTPEDIFVFYPNSPPTQVTANTDRNNPLPDIIIGQNADFSSNLAVPPLGGNLGLGNNPAPTVALAISIDFPKNGDSVPVSPLPEFFGKCPPSTALTIMLDSQSYTINTTSSQWRWSPPAPLMLGNHRLTVTSSSSTRSVDFTVVSAASLPAFTASNSASPAWPTPTIAPPPTEFVTPFSTPTSTPPAPTETLPSPTARQTRPSTESGVPVSGMPGPLLMLLGSSVIFWGASYRIWKKNE